MATFGYGRFNNGEQVTRACIIWAFMAPLYAPCVKGWLDSGRRNTLKIFAQGNAIGICKVGNLHSYGFPKC